MFELFSKPTEIPAAKDALPGRDAALATASHHAVNGNPLKGPYPDGMETAMFGLGCFWGAEKMFWNLDGVYVTAVGYAGARHRTRATKRFALGAPATTRSCLSFSIRKRSRSAN